MHGVTQGFGAFHDNWMTGDISAFARGGKKGVLPQGPVPELSVRIEAEVLVLLSPVRSGPRRRSMLMPRGRCPSTAALTNCGACANVGSMPQNSCDDMKSPFLLFGWKLVG